MFMELKNKGVRRGCSKWFFPVNLISKGGKKIDYSKPYSYRLVLDLKELNAITIKQEYTIPSIKSLHWILTGSKIFTSLDLRSAYHAIELDQGYIKLVLRLNLNAQLKRILVLIFFKKCVLVLQPSVHVCSADFKGFGRY